LIIGRVLLRDADGIAIIGEVSCGGANHFSTPLPRKGGKSLLSWKEIITEEFHSCFKAFFLKLFIYIFIF